MYYIKSGNKQRYITNAATEAEARAEWEAMHGLSTNVEIEYFEDTIESIPLVSVLEGMSQQYEDRIVKVMGELEAVHYHGFNGFNHMMERKAAKYDHFILAFYCQEFDYEYIKEIFQKHGLDIKTLSGAKVSQYHGYILRECRIAVNSTNTVKKLNKRELAKALKASEAAAQKFAIRMN